jgi:hypothetical protein
MVLRILMGFLAVYLAAHFDYPRSGAAPITFAVVGDYGTGEPDTEGRVANMILNTGWNTDFILTAGDNNYGLIDAGLGGQWEVNVGQFYGSMIQARSDGAYPSQTSPVQRFFPALGNHDTSPSGTGQDGNSGGINPGFIDYFHTDPGNPAGRLPAGVLQNDNVYYDFQRGDVHVFVLDSDHARASSASRIAQQNWLRDGLAASTATWKFVTLHHAPYSSGTVHGNHGFLQWPFAEWGADAVFAGHDHIYERSMRFGVPYFVSGLGGQSRYTIGTPEFFSQARYNDDFGAMRVAVDGDVATFEFLSIGDGAGGANGGTLIDSFTMDKQAPRPQHTVLVPRGATWHYLDDGSDQGTEWKELNYPPANAWPRGPAEFGYGDGDEATRIDCGPSSPICTLGNFATTYFRTTFQADPAALDGVTSLLLELVRDDGAAVYLNGREVVRQNLPFGAGYDAYASVSISGDKRETEFVPFVVDPVLLVSGENVLAVEIHQASHDSSDLSFDLQLTTDFAPLPAAPVTLLPGGSLWKYLDDGSDQGTAWKEVVFSPADSWPEGPAQLGYGDGDEATLVNCGPSAPRCNSGNLATTYFRTTFDVADVSRVATLTIELLRDDGAAVYLNGTRVVLDNLAADAAFDDFALSTVSDSAESEFLPFSVDPALLVPGQNFISAAARVRT